MFTIENLHFSYGSNTVLSDLGFEVPRGEVHGIVGLNGSGKTTLFKLVFGMLKPTQGNVYWEGIPLNRKSVAYLETQNYFYSRITGREYLSLFKAGSNNFNLNAWQDLLSLPLDDLIDSYSTGMKKKLALIGVLKLNKPLLILDEPFNGVDLETSRVFKLLLNKLREQGKTILISSHILETLTNSCDQIHLLKNGRIEKSYAGDQIEAMNQEVFKDKDEQTKQLLQRAL